MRERCDWLKNWEKQPIYVGYHDKEWGVPIFNDRKIFEFLVLESAQAGLSWSTILKKRGGYRQAFANFDFNKVAKFNKKDFGRLLGDPAIIRNRLKIKAAINNAQQFLKIRQEFGTFSKYIWGFVDGKPIQNRFRSARELPAKTALAEKISKDLRERGFKFLGPTIVYAHMQATGMVNDHSRNCFRYREIRDLAKEI
ncbi:MAG: DNA-3-methyladenine glycosylase I [Candidatus Yanofskybacteria bacterium CG10_big_fil_rev_8_21_14_0_10_46_23]|uniref:DNA-3-methyladenine glycosylase I n=1 Tax=Candidatus Yanofskybacteria bacterium CG10_big_fil_rev_8_21_14_0_10_46_23 TaxID=1975098 RepID=A0A2H0R497_9BACT|nr:MAG: DNA-3-methyladenine glycosylase I [Candidatus Yanofskybacteria bacterium CG10_big_fil_rev_8_21_14_0_10_46_23]